MKKYRLKKWYPSLPLEWKDNGIIIVEKYDNISYKKLLEEGVFQIISSRDVENNPDFWEEVKQPLFVTEDGVEVFDGDVDVFTTNSSFNKYRFKAKRIKDSGLNHKIFYHESNLYNYIWRNKRVFSYEDFIKWANDINASFEELSQLAKERSKE